MYNIYIYVYELSFFQGCYIWMAYSGYNGLTQRDVALGKNRAVFRIGHGKLPYKYWIYPLKMVIFHSYVNVYQRGFQQIQVLLHPSCTVNPKLCWALVPHF